MRVLLAFLKFVYWFVNKNVNNNNAGFYLYSVTKDNAKLN